MTVPEAVEIMKQHNRWRRGEIDTSPHSPKQIGQAIDVLCDTSDNLNFDCDDEFRQLSYCGYEGTTLLSNEN